MISYIRGELVALEEDKVIVDVGGMGYGIFMSGQAMGQLPPVGSKVKIHTYLNVKEDAMQLYGFLSREDLELFRMLLGVSGVGPKAALGVLSVLTADDVRFAVLSDDSKTIARAPGIGPKTAKKIILELKDRLSLEDAFEHRLSQNRQEDDVLPPAMNPQDEAVQALAALDYSAAESLRAVRSLEDTEGMDTETILKMALKKLSRF